MQVVLRREHGELSANAQRDRSQKHERTPNEASVHL
jgi:hypothetical protein